MARIVTIDELRKAKRQTSFEAPVPYMLNGKSHTATKKVVNGEMEVYDLQKPIGEMIGTPAVHRELVEKVVFDVELGREQVPILYDPIYERREDRNFPKQFEAPWASHGVIVFHEWEEGEEIKFGHIQAEKGPIAKLTTYAAGFEYNEDMEEWNQTWDMTELDRAFGEAYNALLNHIHLFPIIDFNYQAGNTTNAIYVNNEGKKVTGADQALAHPALSMRETLLAGIAKTTKEKRKGNILLISESRLDHVKRAMGEMHIRGTDFASVAGIDTIIAYDGWNVKVGKKDYSYAGVKEDEAFLIRPKRGFKELIKHDLLVDATLPDLSRLVTTQIVGRTRRGVFAAVEENVQKIKLPDTN